MGQLPICYAFSRLAIVAGSFTDKVGGHNVFEPCLYGCPSFFGPYTFSQTEFAKRVLEAGAGLQISLENLRSTLDAFSSEKEAQMRASAITLANTCRGATQKTLFYIRENFVGNK